MVLNIKEKVKAKQVNFVLSMLPAQSLAPKDPAAASQTPKSPLVAGSSILSSRMSPSLLKDSALINAVRNNDEAQVRELERTESGLKNAQDETALMVAAANNRPIFCKILVSAENPSQITEARTHI